MGDCQSKNKSADVNEPTIESRTQESPDQKDQHLFEEERAKHKPENGRSFGENWNFCLFFKCIFR